jgi:Niemann-Pick C1 protein
MTTFVAFLSWDHQRRIRNRYDCFFCFSDPDQELKGERDLVKGFMDKHYVPLLNRLWFQILAFALFLGLFSLSVLGCLKLKVGLNEQVSFSEGSDIFNYLNYEAKYIAAGPPAYLVLKNLDYKNPNDLKLATDLGNSLSQLNDTVQPPVYSWVSTFLLFISTEQDWSIACNTKDIMSYTFGEQLKRFLAVQIDSDCCQSYGICG